MTPTADQILQRCKDIVEGIRPQPLPFTVHWDESTEVFEICAADMAVVAITLGEVLGLGEIQIAARLLGMDTTPQKPQTEFSYGYDWSYATEQQVFAWADENDALGWATDGRHTFKSVYNHGLVNGAKYGHWLASSGEVKPDSTPAPIVLEWVEDSDCGTKGDIVARFNGYITASVEASYKDKGISSYAAVFIEGSLFKSTKIVMEITPTTTISEAQAWCLTTIKEIVTQTPKK